MSYYVQSTVRERDCDRSAPIVKLVLDRAVSGGNVWPISSLKPLADQGQLWSRCARTGNIAKVRIFYSYRYTRWIATTRADESTCDNLLSLPIRSETQGYAVCAI